MLSTKFTQQFFGISLGKSTPKPFFNCLVIGAKAVSLRQAKPTHMHDLQRDLKELFCRPGEVERSYAYVRYNPTICPKVGRPKG